MADRSMSVIPGPDGKPMNGEDMDFTVLEESTGKYRADDGTVLELRLVPQKISRGMAKDGTVFYKDDGEPYYILRFNAIITPRVQKTMLHGV